MLSLHSWQTVVLRVKTKKLSVCLQAQQEIAAAQQEATQIRQQAAMVMQEAEQKLGSAANTALDVEQKQQDLSRAENALRSRMVSCNPATTSMQLT